MPALVLLVGWELAARFALFDPTFVGQPVMILLALASHLTQYAFWRDIGITFEEVSLGYLFGGVLGGVMGYVLGMNHRLAVIFEPYVLALNAVPKVAIAPILIALLGIGTTSKVVISASMVFFLMFYSVFVGIKTMNIEFTYLVRLMGGSRWAVIRYVVIPSLMPNILGGMKASVVFAVIGAVVGEYIAADGGLGHFVLVAAGIFDMNEIWAGTIMLMAMVLVISSLIGVLERRLLRWLPPKDK